MKGQDLYSRALRFSKNGENERALQDFNAILISDPKNADVLCDRAVVRYHLKDAEGALKDLDEAVSIEPFNPYLYASRACIRERSGDLSGAIEDYRMALELDPENIISGNNLELLEEKLMYSGKVVEKQASAAIKGRHDAVSVLDEADKVVAALLGELNISAPEYRHKSGLFNKMFSVFTSRSERRDFLNFLRRLFRL